MIVASCATFRSREESIGQWTVSRVHNDMLPYISQGRETHTYIHIFTICRRPTRARGGSDRRQAASLTGRQASLAPYSTRRCPSADFMLATIKTQVGLLLLPL